MIEDHTDGVPGRGFNLKFAVRILFRPINQPLPESLPLHKPPPDFTIADRRSIAQTQVEMSSFLKFYLVAYNSLQASAWTVSLLRILSSFLSSKTINSAYSSAGDLISVAQTVAVAEVLHGAIGIVPTGMLTPLMQWSGRVHFILAVVRQIKEVQDLPMLSITLVAWCLGEMIRYPHYALTSFGRCPFWLTYIRYTAFVVNFPIGLVGEVLIMYKALPYIKNKNLYANLFSIFPFSYYDFLRVLLLSYPFLWLKLYLHMVKQRKSKLGKSDKHQGKRKRM